MFRRKQRPSLRAAQDWFRNMRIRRLRSRADRLEARAKGRSGPTAARYFFTAAKLRAKADRLAAGN